MSEESLAVIRRVVFVQPVTVNPGDELEIKEIPGGVPEISLFRRTGEYCVLRACLLGTTWHSPVSRVDLSVQSVKEAK